MKETRCEARGEGREIAHAQYVMPKRARNSNTFSGNLLMSSGTEFENAEGTFTKTLLFNRVK